MNKLQESLDQNKANTQQEFKELMGQMENSQSEANTLKQQLEDKIKILFDKESNLTESEKTID